MKKFLGRKCVVRDDKSGVFWRLVKSIDGQTVEENRKSKKKKLVDFAEVYLNNALRHLDNNDIEGAKSEIKWALRKSNMRIYSDGK